MLWKIKTDERIVYLTFDDGPHPTVTPWVLDELKKYNFKATFFCVGNNVRLHRSIYEKVIAEGHRTGNHTYDHIKGWKTVDHLYYDNIEQCAQLVDSNLFRPPYGQVTLAQVNELKKNYLIIMWSLLSGDFDKKLNVNKALELMKKHTKPGSIIVFHDSEKAKSNLMKILPQYLQFLKEQGYSCQTL
ncbi:MAG: polysaccharide deacetylase family protein [Bacteroidia bacterium]|nr:polysaccharide deacetylase family protein [Bacteroidia bacterium]